MKKFITLLILSCIWIAAFATGTDAETIEQAKITLLDFVVENAVYITPILIWVVNRFIPTKWRDPIVMFLNWLNTLIPDKKIGGGKHNEKK